MGLLVSGSGSAGGKVLVDCVEGWNGFHNLGAVNANGQVSDFRSEVQTGEGGTQPQLFPAVSGAVGPLAFDAAIGRVVHPWVSLAAATSISGSAVGGSFGIPFYQRFAVASAIPVASFPRPFRRYRVDYLVRGIIGPGAADVTCGFVSNAAGSMVTGGPNTNPMVCWCARAAINGGNWTPRFRLVNAAAIQNGSDSGVNFITAPSRVEKLSVVYEEGVTPRIRWLINDREVFQLAGDANMPDIAGSCFVAKAVGLGAGASQSNWCESRLRIEEM